MLFDQLNLNQPKSLGNTELVKTVLSISFSFPF